MKLVVKNEMTSVELVEQINIFRKKEGKLKTLGHNDLMKVIRDEFEEELREGKISLSSKTVDMPKGGTRKQPLYLLTLTQAKQVLVRESKFVRRAIIQYIEKLEQALKETKQEVKKEIKLEQKKLPFGSYKIVNTKSNIQLIGIYQTDTKEYFIKAKDLWKILEINNYYKSWINSRIEKYDFIEDYDYVCLTDDNALTLDMAKGLLTIENTPTARLVRKYIIAFEKELKIKQRLEIEKMKERLNNRKVGYIINNNFAVRKYANETIDFVKTLEIGKVITPLNKEKLNNLCILLKAYAYPYDLDKKFGIDTKPGFMPFEYYPPA